MPFFHDSTGISDGIQLLPKGWYKLKITETTEKQSRNGDPLVNMKCMVVDDARYVNKWVYHSVVFLKAGQNGAGMSIHFRKSIGVPYEGNVEVDPREWAGKTFMGFIIEDEYDGKKRNKISEIKPLAEAEDDNVPF